MRISAAAVEGLPTLHDDGALFQLTFRAIGQLNYHSALDLREFISGLGGSAIYPYPGLTAAPLVLQDGVFHTDGILLRGDLNGDGRVDMQDVNLALEFASWVTTPTPEQLQAGDINGNGVIDAGDAACILYYVQYGVWPTMSTMSALAHSLNTGPLRFQLDDFGARPGQTVRAIVQAENLRNVAGATLAIAYDPTALVEITKVSAVGLAQDLTLEYHLPQPGLLVVSWASATPLAGSGAVLAIEARLSPELKPGAASPVTLADITLTDQTGRNLVYSSWHYTIERIHGTLHVHYGVFLPLALRR